MVGWLVGVGRKEEKIIAVQERLSLKRHPTQWVGRANLFVYAPIVEVSSWHTEKNIFYVC